MSARAAGTSARVMLVRDKDDTLPTDPIRGPADVWRLMQSRGALDEPGEVFWLLCLNTRHRITTLVEVTRGILDASLIHPREVYRTALLASAAGIIVVHNHPSGDPTPSTEDRAVTRQLAEAGRTVGVPLLDHVVIGDDGFRSICGDEA